MPQTQRSVVFIGLHYPAAMPLEPAASATEPPLLASTTLVLDTNVVLDWLVFRDPSGLPLDRLVNERRARLLTHPPALEELRRVLAYPQCKLDLCAQREVLERYQSATSLAALPAGFDLAHLMLPVNFPRCSDPDDQHFLALAYHARADALVTKDRAVLRLRKRAAGFGVTLLTPPQLTVKLGG